VSVTGQSGLHRVICDKGRYPGAATVQNRTALSGDASKKMKRTIYQLLMSVAAGAVIGGIVANLVNIMDPEFDMDYGVAIGFFTIITWGLLAVLDMLFRKPERPAAAPASAPPAAPARR
jgi:hypothetical protein